MQNDFDAVIVGAGPAGSAAAILLARAGWSVALVEKQIFPRRKVCGECIGAGNLPLLAALGVSGELVASAGPALHKVALMHGHRKAVANLPAAPNPASQWGRALGRETLDTLLVAQARAAGAHLFQPCTVRSIDGSAGAWRVEVRRDDLPSGLTLRSRVAIAAHGSWETLPSGRPHRRLDRSGADLLAFKANFRGASLEPGVLPVLSFKGGYGGMVMAGGGVTTVACCIRRDRLETSRWSLPGQSAGDVVEALLKKECEDVRLVLQGAARDGPWLAAGPIDPGVRLRADDELFRIGNAAGEAHPIIGEGMSMALQSAWMLCAQLLVCGRSGASLDKSWQREVAARYAAQWRGAFALRLHVASIFANVAMRPYLAVPFIACANVWPGLLTLGAQLSGKANCVVDTGAFPAFAAQPIQI